MDPLCQSALKEVLIPTNQMYADVTLEKSVWSQARCITALTPTHYFLFLIMFKQPEGPALSDSWRLGSPVYKFALRSFQYEQSLMNCLCRSIVLEKKKWFKTSEHRDMFLAC